MTSSVVASNEGGTVRPRLFWRSGGWLHYCAAGTTVRLPSDTLRECGHSRWAALCRYCCKSPKLLGDNFLAIRRSDPRPPIFTVSITLPRSPVSLSSGDEVPHIFTRKSRLKPGEFLITSAKGLLQQNLPGAVVSRCSKVQAQFLFTQPPHRQSQAILMGSQFRVRARFAS